MNSSRVPNTPQAPFGSDSRVILYWMFHPVAGDDERGEIDAKEEESSKLELKTRTRLGVLARSVDLT